MARFVCMLLVVLSLTACNVRELSLIHISASVILGYRIAWGKSRKKSCDLLEANTAAHIANPAFPCFALSAILMIRNVQGKAALTGNC